MAVMQPLAPADLFIDEENPRISQPNAGQNRALQSLAEHLGPKLVALAADIVAHGTDPADLPIVMAHVGHQGRFTVLEGNRRLAALRVLESPDSVSDAVNLAHLRQLRKLSKDYQANPVDQIVCVVVRDRDEARHWIELRHTGENGGAGRVPWGSDESARFRSRGKPEIHSQALDFLQRRKDLTPESRRLIPASSLKRLLETPELRARIGIETQKGDLHLLADEGRIAKALMHIINDLTSGTTKVGQIYTKAQRQAYAKNLPADIAVKPTTKSGHGTAATSTTSSGSGTKPHARTPRKRDRLIPRDSVLSIPKGRIYDIEVELRKLSLEDSPNAVSVLFRVFTELSVDSYLEDHPLGATDNDKLRKKIELVANDLEAKKKINKQQGRAIRSANQAHSSLAPGSNTMNDYVHNEYIFPSAGDLRALWSSLQPFITAIWTP